jgi:hypothetical protein
MKKYELLDGTKLLTPNSWLWMAENKNAKDNEYHIVFVELEAIFEFEGELTKISERIDEWRAEHEHKYDKLFVDKVTLFLGCGETEEKMFLIGRRLETEKERDARIVRHEREAQENLHTEAEKRKKATEAEYSRYLKLKAIYE